MAGFHFEVQRVSCNTRFAVEPATIRVDYPIDGVRLSGPLKVVARSVLPEISHATADLLVGLEPGCYEVLAAPARRLVGDAWIPSTDCSRARSGRIRVTRGRTAVASLLPQCAGDRHGERDVIALLNHPPSVSFEADALAVDPRQTVRACATAFDPDDDPVTVAFAADAPPERLAIRVGEPEVVGFEDGHRLWRACADIVGAAPDAYRVRAEVHDLGWSLGRMVRLEELVAPAASSARTTLPVRVGCGDEPCS